MITTIIIAVTVITSIIGFSNKRFAYGGMFNAYDIVQNKKYYKLITHGFLHADTTHLLFNMIALYCFGRIVEMWFFALLQFSGTRIGDYVYILLYLSAIVVASLPDLYKHRNNPNYYSLGASGAISAVLFSAILFEPTMKIYVFLIQIGIPAAIFAPVYLIYCQWMAKRGRDNIGHSAHFWGAVYGLVFTIIAYPNSVENFVSTIFGL